MNQKTERYIEYAQFLNASEKVVYWVKHTLNNHLEKNDPSIEEVEHILDYLVSPDAHDCTKMSYLAAKKNAENWTKTLMKKGGKENADL